MLYSGHGAIPDEDVFQQTRLESPNCSARMDNMRAALVRYQLPHLDENIRRWNARYSILAQGLSRIPGVHLPERQQHEEYVGSSIQFQAKQLGPDKIPAFIEGCAERGIDIKWFGADAPHAFTSRFDSWRYLKDIPELPKTRDVLSTTCDMRVPLTFSEQDCADLANLITPAHRQHVAA